MAETEIQSAAPRRKSSVRKLAWIGGALVALVVVLYFVTTSSAFLKGVVLPRVGKALHAELTASEIDLSPFSRISVRDLKLVPQGAEPLFSASAVRARYHLLAILRGKLNVDELVVDSPTLTVVQNADGTSNLDPLLEREPSPKPATPAPPAKPSPPPAIDIKSVAINNVTIRRTQNLKGGGRESLEVTGASLTASNLKNGAAGKVEFKAAIAMNKTPAAPAAPSALAARLDGSFTFDLTPDLKPATVKGAATLSLDQASGDFADFNTLAAKLDCDATPTDVKQVSLTFAKAGAALGELRISGPLDAARTEGRLNVSLLSLDRRVLNLFGAAAGIDFGTTTINSTNVVVLAKAGSVISASGQLNAARVQITRQGQTTPTLDLRCDYDVAVNRAEQNALLKALRLAGTQNQRPLLQATLDQPMTVAWGNTGGAVGDAALNLGVTGLDLADWRAFAGTAAPAGVANLNLKLLSQQGGKQLSFDLDSQVQGLSARAGAAQISPMDVHLLVRGRAADLKQINLVEYRLDLAQRNQPLVTVSGSGTFDRATQNADLQLALQTSLPRLLQLLPQPDLNASAGTVNLKARVTRQQQIQNATGQMALADFTARYGKYRFDHFSGTIDFDVGVKGNQIEIRKAAGDLREGASAGGRFNASGNLEMATKAGHVDVTLADINQNGLRPFLESALGDKKLVSVSLNATASAGFAAQGDSAIKADLQITNLVVSDPRGQVPATPLAARVRVDTTVGKQVAQLRECQLSLTPTERAKNELGLSGKVDFSRTNAITGGLKLAADSLDVTRYYDLFAGKAKSAGTNPAAPSQVAAPAASPNREPDAVNLPFRNFEADASIGRFYLHEVEITNLQATAKIDGGHVVVKPFQLALNGAPVAATADLDLGVPGYKYDVAFNATQIPLAPLVNSFQPDRKGQIGGVLTANAQVKGAGVTGTGLQKNLTGQFDVVSTNLNYSIANVRSKTVNTIVNVIVGIPDLIRNPTAVVGNFLGRLTGAKQSTSSGWADELTAAPIQVISARGSAGNGQVTLEDAVVRSAAFEARAKGLVTLESVWTNSTLQVPITVSLNRSMAGKIGLASAQTPAGDTYVALPQFLTLRGTVGDPKSEVNKMVLVELAARTGAGVAGQIGGAAGGKAGSILNAVGGLLGGGRANPSSPEATPPAAAQTNPPPAQPPPRRGLLDLLGPPK